jgi:phage baseplate assembly protein V
MSFKHVMRVGKLTAPVNETGVVQQMQIQTSAWEVRDSINSMQLYGFASSPKPGCDVVVLNVAADNSNGNIIATNDQRYRPLNLSSGEVKVYDDSGQAIYLSKTGGVLSVKIVGGSQVNISCSTSVSITAPTVAITGNLTVSGTIIAMGNVTAGTVELQGHHHTNVQGGTGNSGGPVG